MIYETIYLDNNATTSLDGDVAVGLIELFVENVYGNPSSAHYSGIGVRLLLESCRKKIADSIGAEFNEVYFTSGGTESNNLAILGAISSIGGYGTTNIVTTSAEHPSVFETVKAVCPEGFYEIPLTREGRLDISKEAYDKLSECKFASVMLVNNITGAIFNVKEICEIVHGNGGIVHSDAVQAYGKLPIDVKELGVDLLTLSGHKIHALPGIGVLYIKNGTVIDKTVFGGFQEKGFRPGTENYIGALSMGIAAKSINVHNNIEGLRDAFETSLKNKIPGIIFHGSTVFRVSNTSCFSIPGIDATTLMYKLDNEGIQVSTGAACSSGLSTPPRVLTAMNVPKDLSSNSLRVSLSKNSSIKDITVAITKIVSCYSELKL